MIVQKFEFLLSGESDPTTVIHRFLGGVTPEKELSRKPSWPRKALVGRVVGGELQWQRLAYPAFEEMTSPHGRAKLERVRDGIRVVATVELRTLCVIGWSIPASVAVVFAIMGQVLPLILLLVFAGFIYLQIEGLRRSLGELLLREGPTQTGTTAPPSSPSEGGAVSRH